MSAKVADDDAYVQVIKACFDEQDKLIEEGFVRLEERISEKIDEAKASTILWTVGLVTTLITITTGGWTALILSFLQKS